MRTAASSRAWASSWPGFAPASPPGPDAGGADPLICSQEVAYESYEHRSHREERRPAGAADAGLAGADGRRGVRTVVRRRAGWPVRAWPPGRRPGDARGLRTRAFRDHGRADGAGAPLRLAL